MIFFSQGTIKFIAADGKLVGQIVVLPNNSKINISTLAKEFFTLQYNDVYKVLQLKIIKE